MNCFEKLLYYLQGDMDVPVSFGWFHIMCIFVALVVIFILCKCRKFYNEKQLKLILGVYGIIVLILEVGKQLIWSFNYDTVTNIVSWKYQWYIFPFQLCTTPMYIAILCLFLKKCKFRDSLLSYVSYITILGSIATIIFPESCFTRSILVNIHTMWLHLGSMVLSVYLLVSGEVKINIQAVKDAIIVFLILLGIADIMNVVVYKLDILNGEVFNMFYVSPYFDSTLPLFSILQTKLPYILYLFSYAAILVIGGFIVYIIACLISFINRLIIKK